MLSGVRVFYVFPSVLCVCFVTDLSGCVCAYCLMMYCVVLYGVCVVCLCLCVIRLMCLRGACNLLCFVVWFAFVCDVFCLRA